MLTIEIISTALAVAGCWMNNRRRRVCFVLWILSNAICCVLHCAAGLHGLAGRDVIFSILAVEGFLKWKGADCDAQ